MWMTSAIGAGKSDGSAAAILLSASMPPDDAPITTSRGMSGISDPHDPGDVVSLSDRLARASRGMAERRSAQRICSHPDSHDETHLSRLTHARRDLRRHSPARRCARQLMKRLALTSRRGGQVRSVHSCVRGARAHDSKTAPASSPPPRSGPARRTRGAHRRNHRARKAEPGESQPDHCRSAAPQFGDCEKTAALMDGLTGENRRDSRSAFRAESGAAA